MDLGLSIFSFDVVITDKSSESSDEGERAKARCEELEAAHLHDGGAGDGAPGGEEGAEHDGHDHKGPVLLTEGHGQGGDTSDTWEKTFYMDHLSIIISKEN